ncbi:hypothetical protein PLICRDRAFT_34794 [Plicaturopsis crispa FD-325 SS-3]|nr:hypothetical protein PLICRDRAFT_34794 [Plicaturopsis crispa FD-325 SS-3]
MGKLGENLPRGDKTLMWLIAVPVPAQEDTDDSPPAEYGEPAERPPGRWAGDQIICVGDGGHDWPESIQDHPDVRWLAENVDPDPDPQAYYDPNTVDNLYKLAYEDYGGQRRPSECGPKRSKVFPPGPWVLRNLTKRVYVRAACLKSQRDELPDDEVDLEHSHASTFLGEVVLSRVCWSSDYSCSMNRAIGDRIARGVWAGDRFDIVNMTSLDALPDVEQWKDISDEVREEIRSMWVIERGQDPFQPAEATEAEAED